MADDETCLMAYADPPYIGTAKSHYGDHEDFAGEVDHRELIGRLVDDYPDGWALSLSCKSLQHILGLCPDDVRVLSWVKPLSPFLPGIRLQYAWEPVILRGGRQGKHTKGEDKRRDWLSCSAVGMTFRPREDGYVIGRKPDQFCHWIFDCLGLRPGDTLDDLFPGSGAVARAWTAWSSQERLAV